MNLLHIVYFFVILKYIFST